MTERPYRAYLIAMLARTEHRAHHMRKIGAHEFAASLTSRAESLKNELVASH